MCGIAQMLGGALFGGGQQQAAPTPEPLPDPNMTQQKAEEERRKRAAAAKEQQDKVNPTGGGLNIMEDLKGANAGGVRRAGMGAR